MNHNQKKALELRDELKVISDKLHEVVTSIDHSHKECGCKGDEACLFCVNVRGYLVDSLTTLKQAERVLSED